MNFPEVSITFYLKDFFQAKTLHFCLILLFFLPLITVSNFSIGKILKTHYLLSCFTFATLKLTKLPRQVCIAVNKTTKSTAKTLLQGDYRLFKPQSNLLHPNSNKQSEQGLKTKLRLHIYQIYSSERKSSLFLMRVTENYQQISNLSNNNNQIHCKNPSTRRLLAHLSPNPTYFIQILTNSQNKA